MMIPNSNRATGSNHDMDSQQEQARTLLPPFGARLAIEAEGRANEYNVVEARNRAALDIISRFLLSPIFSMSDAARDNSRSTLLNVEFVRSASTSRPT